MMCNLLQTIFDQGYVKLLSSDIIEKESNCVYLYN